MKSRSIFLAVMFAFTAPVAACGGGGDGNDRWVTTENTNVDIDWDQVAEAYKKAEGPEDFEQKVNEIYSGDEVISVDVHDKDEKTQEVTGFFDKNTNGTIDEGEKIFVINREITGEETGQMHIQGYGHYAHYRSPMWDIAGGMVLGSMISRAFMPGYTPVYTTRYVTSPTRVSSLATHRNSYRAANPSKFPKSQSGRSYGSKGGSFSSRSSSRSFGGGSRSGGGFGVTPPRKLRVVRLTA
ncbi:MAG: hypothetical protein R3A51_06215 [Nannocystaceae bacterium]|nr:hypothetical protein [Myxococcales bacterium]